MFRMAKNSFPLDSTANAARTATGAAPRATRTPARRSDFLTPIEVADRLLIAPVTVRLWASKGLLPSVTTPGGHRRFRVADVDAFVARHQVSKVCGGSAPERVLLIDHNPTFARHLANMLTARVPNITTEIAYDGFSAGIKCHSLRPDVVTVDLEMRDVNPYDICLLLRSNFGGAVPRIVALVGRGSTHNLSEILTAGADACVERTSPPAVLLRELGFVAAIPAANANPSTVPINFAMQST
jgi:excisionase family DNA binding protein